MAAIVSDDEAEVRECCEWILPPLLVEYGISARKNAVILFSAFSFPCS